jgi:ankyrin repeat protein
LKNINQATRVYAHRLLQCLTVAVRPLRLEELAEVLAFDFDEAPGGIPKLNADWRREDQERAVLSTCSSLIAIVHDGDSRVVQFSHFSVKEFLTSDRLAATAEDISFYHIAPTPAHTILVRACLSVLLRSDDAAWETFAQRFPLAEYAVHHWINHALFENVSLHIKYGVENLFDQDQPHFSRWIRNCDMEDSYEWRDDDSLHEAAPMYYAAFCGFPGVIEKLISEHPERVSIRGGPLGTSLHAASRMNHLKIVESLLRHGADVNAPGMWGRTPLLFASSRGHLEVVRWLLEHDADVNAKDQSRDWTSLHLAAYYGHLEIVQTLLEHNADTAARDKSGSTPLHQASGCERVDIVRLLLNNGAGPKAHDDHQNTSLHIASYSGNLGIARLLLEHGAEVDVKNRAGRAAYQIAFEQGHDEVVQLLLVYGAKSTT